LLNKKQSLYFGSHLVI